MEKGPVISLLNLSTNKVAALISELPDVRNKLEPVLHSSDDCWQMYNVKKSTESRLGDLSPGILKLVLFKLDQLNDLDLPKTVKLEIKDRVLEMFMEIFDWNKYLIQHLNLNQALEKIYWSSDEIPAEDKSFTYFWLNYLNEKSDEFDPNLKWLQYVGCLFGQEKFISLLEKDLMEEIQFKDPLTIENNSDAILKIMKMVVAYFYISRHFAMKKSSFIRSKLSFQSSVDMISICRSLGLNEALIYFWSHLNSQEQFNYFEKEPTCRSALVNEKIKYGDNYPFKIALLMTNDRIYSQRYHFILHNFSVMISMLSGKRPFQNFCLPLLEIFLPQIEPCQKTSLLRNYASVLTESKPEITELEILRFLLLKTSVEEISNAFSDLFDVKTAFGDMNVAND